MKATTISGLLLATAATVLAAPSNETETPTVEASLVNGTSFDYVIIGCGLSGSVLARRLAQEGNATVLLLEAGSNEQNNVNVTDISKYQAAFGTPLDWQFQTVNQTAAGGKTQTLRSGRGLGGSTLINGMAWSKPHDFQIDSLAEVGNDGLNWEALAPYMIGVESFTAPTAEQLSQGVTYNGQCRGKDGPIAVMVNDDAHPSEFEHAYNQTGLDLGMPYPGDLTCGNPAGLSAVSHTSKDGVRSDAYHGYLLDQDLPNLTVLTQAMVGKVLLSNDTTPHATGVEFRNQNGTTYTASANREVLLTAGSIMTPIILQHSGIGPASVLEAAGVKQILDLPVGQNLIDQTTYTTNWATKTKGGMGLPIMFPRFEDLVTGDDAKNLRGMLENNIDVYVEDAVKSGAASNATAAGLKKVLEIQRHWILSKNSSVSESFDYTYDNVIGYDSWFLLPFGRGSISISNSDPYGTNYTIDPRYFANEFDTLASAATARFTRSYSESAPLSEHMANETTPGDSVQASASLEDWATWIKTTYRPNWHPIGTASMMSKDLGGVVDSRHRVYGVERLRVIDASNLPFQVSSHLMSVMYGLTERAADIIKVDNGGSAGTVNEADTLGASEGNSTSNGDSNSDSNSNSTSSESADTGDDRNSATAASLSLWTVLLSVSAAYFL